jgi:hypothetical protein
MPRRRKRSLVPSLVVANTVSPSETRSTLVTTVRGVAAWAEGTRKRTHEVKARKARRVGFYSIDYASSMSPGCAQQAS